MAVIRLEINDKYLENFLNFLKLMPKNIIKIEIEDDFEKELLKRSKEIKEGKVKLLTEKEIFDEIWTKISSKN